MIILGIDPAVNKLGYGVITEERGLLKVLGHGRITPQPDLDFQAKLELLSAKIEEVVDTFSPEAIAIEEIYVAKNARVALRIGQVIGLVLGLAIQRKMRFALIPPRDIKKCVVGTGAAEKDQVKYMVEHLTGVKNIPSFDESDALAAAISYLTYKESHDLLDRGNAL